MPPYPYGNQANDFYLRQAQQIAQPQFQPHGQKQEQFQVVPVSNIDEARNAIINPLSAYLFVDYGTGNIYFKRMGNNGLAEFLVYTVQENVKENKSDPLAEINSRLANIESVLGGFHDKSVSSNAAYEQSATGSNAIVTDQIQPNDSAESNGLSKNAGNGWRKK